MHSGKEQLESVLPGEYSDQDEDKGSICIF